MKRALLRPPPFVLLTLTATALAAGIALLFAVAVGRGAPGHAAGMLLKACTSASQVAGGVASLTLLALPLLVVAAALARGVRVQMQTRRVLRQLTPSVERIPGELERAAAEAGLGNAIEIADTDELIAFTYGLHRPRILLSTGALAALSRAELAAVLAHEAHHVRRRDPLRVYLAEVASRAFALVPLLGAIARYFVESTELAADRHAMTHAGRRPLAAALLKFLESPRPAAIPSLALEGPHDRRIAHLLEPQGFQHKLRIEKHTIRRTAYTVAAVGLLTTILAALPPML